MVLDLPGGLFGQDDVRETAVATTGTSFWSCKGAGFISYQPDVSDYRYLTTTGQIDTTGNGIFFLASVNLPHAAVITKVLVEGTAAETWTLYKVVIGDSPGDGTPIATANLGTEDTSISEPIVDNEAFAYVIITSSLDAGDDIYGARITYTI